MLFLLVNYVGGQAAKIFKLSLTADHILFYNDERNFGTQTFA